jgi:hypothetical protein
VDRDEILGVLRAFEAAGLDYVLIGATAMGFHGVVRATEDVDLMIRATADNVEKLRTALRAVYDDPQIDEISTADLLGDYPAVRYYPPTGDLYFDVLTRLGDAVSFESVDAETKRTEGIAVRFMSVAECGDAGCALPDEEGHGAGQGPPGRRDAATAFRPRGGRLMPVEKFRSIDEMDRALVRVRAVDGVEAFFRHCARYWAVAPRVYPRGVFRLRSVEDAARLSTLHRTVQR